MINSQSALIYTMVLMSAADSDMTDAELHKIGEIIRDLPAFKGYDVELLPSAAASCVEIIDTDDGLDRIFDLIEAALPVRLRETAYAMACDIAAADGEVNQEELRLLEIIRHRLSIDRLSAAAIERGARARFAKL